MKLAITSSFDPLSQFGSGSENDSDEGDEESSEAEQVSLLKKTKLKQVVVGPEVSANDNCDSKKPAFDFESLAAFGYCSPEVQIGLSPTQLRQQTEALVTASKEYEKELVTEANFQESIKQAQKVIRDERKEVRELARSRELKRKMRGPSVKGKSGSWVEGMSSLARRSG